MKKVERFSIAGCVICFELPSEEIGNNIKKIFKFLRPFEISRVTKSHMTFIHSTTQSQLNKNTIYANLKILHDHQLSILLQKVVIRYMTDNSGILLHCSSVRLSSSSVALFIGDSGAGKTTISSFLDSIFPILTDDIGIVKIYNEKAYLYPTPFLETHKRIHSSSRGYLIKDIYYLNKSNKVRRTRIHDISKVISLLYAQLWIDEANKDKQLPTLIQLARVDAYNLQFPNSQKAVVKAFGGMY